MDIKVKAGNSSRLWMAAMPIWLLASGCPSEDACIKAGRKVCSCQRDEERTLCEQEVKSRSYSLEERAICEGWLKQCEGVNPCLALNECGTTPLTQ